MTFFGGMDRARRDRATLDIFYERGDIINSFDNKQTESEDYCEKRNPAPDGLCIFLSSACEFGDATAGVT